VQTAALHIDYAIERSTQVCHGDSNPYHQIGQRLAAHIFGNAVNTAYPLELGAVQLISGEKNDRVLKQSWQVRQSHSTIQHSCEYLSFDDTLSGVSMAYIERGKTSIVYLSSALVMMSSFGNTLAI